MRPLAWLLPLVAQAVEWCPDALFNKAPPPPLSLPVFLSAPGAATQREVAFEVSIGGSVVDAATAFSLKHAIGEDARDALVEAAHAREARGAPVARAVVITSEHADWALKRPGTLLLLVGGVMDCQRAARQNASGLAVAHTEDEALLEASLMQGSMVVLATQSAPELSLNEVLAEHERIRHARGGDGVFVLAIPDVSGDHDSVLAFPSSLSGDRSENKFYRAWWAVAHLFNEIHDEDPPETPLSCDETCPDIAVVVYHQGLDDTSTRGTFFEISRSVVRGLRALGLQARLTHCVDASQGCAFHDHERRIHLATHNLQVFLDLATMAPLILKRRDFLPQFADDVAFNFEYVPLAINATEVEEASAKRTDAVQNAHGSFATAAALATLKKAERVWDYSLANVEPLSTLTNVEHVPLGWSTAWRPHSELLRLIKEKDIPILFYGTLTARRKRTLQMLRSNDLPIFHANAQTDGTFAPALDALILSASIILDLRAFDSTNTREWKMPRLAKLLAAGAFVVSEGACGVEHQCATYAEGVVFTDDLVATLQYYLERPVERSRVAARGKALFEARTFGKVLRGPVERWLNNVTL